MTVDGNTGLPAASSSWQACALLVVPETSFLIPEGDSLGFLQGLDKVTTGQIYYPLPRICTELLGLSYCPVRWLI